jgi:hypothetical protein
LARKLTVSFQDVNGIFAATHFWCNDLVTAIAAMQSLANLSNAQIVGGYLAQPIDLAGVTGNTASNANVETARTKAIISLSGADLGSVAAPRQSMRIAVPAPVGSIINGINGDPAGALVTPFIGKTTTNSGVLTDRIDRVYYSKG